MRKHHAIDALLPKTRQQILAAALLKPEKPWYLSELARHMGVPGSSLQRELRNLTDAGILKERREGRMVYFQANSDSPLFPELRGLMLKTAGLVDVLADALKPLAAKLRLAFIYGSVASGTEDSYSDVDLMVIGGISPRELAMPLRKARESINRDINPTVYSAAEFDRKRIAKDHFLTHVLDKPRLDVIGNSDELAKAAGR